MGGDNIVEWSAVFRDGTALSSVGDNLSSDYLDLVDYICGTVDNPKKHYLLWASLLAGDALYRVVFDSDGDAYVVMDDGNMVMTNYKIRSAHLILDIDNKILGFGGDNTMGEFDGVKVDIEKHKVSRPSISDIIK